MWLNSNFSGITSTPTNTFPELLRVYGQTLQNDNRSICILWTCSFDENGLFKCGYFQPHSVLRTIITILFLLVGCLCTRHFVNDRIKAKNDLVRTAIPCFHINWPHQISGRGNIEPPRFKKVFNLRANIVFFQLDYFSVQSVFESTICLTSLELLDITLKKMSENKAIKLHRYNISKFLKAEYTLNPKNIPYPKTFLSENVIFHNLGMAFINF